MLIFEEMIMYFFSTFEWALFLVDCALIVNDAVSRYVCKRLDARIFPDRKLKPFTLEEKKSALNKMADDLFTFTF